MTGAALKFKDPGPPIGPGGSRSRACSVKKIVTPQWTLRQVSILRELWGRSSADAIGKLIGKTRNAVIGKADRIGLPTIDSDTRGLFTSAGLYQHYYGPEKS